MFELRARDGLHCSPAVLSRSHLPTRHAPRPAEIISLRFYVMHHCAASAGSSANTESVIRPTEGSMSGVRCANTAS